MNNEEKIISKFSIYRQQIIDKLRDFATDIVNNGDTDDHIIVCIESRAHEELVSTILKGLQTNIDIYATQYIQIVLPNNLIKEYMRAYYDEFNFSDIELLFSKKGTKFNYVRGVFLVKEGYLGFEVQSRELDN